MPVPHLSALLSIIPQKKSIIAASVLSIVLSCAAVFQWNSFFAVTIAKIVQGAAASAIPPALTGITLGLVGQKGLAAQLGRNEAWNHAGNAGTAVLSGIIGYCFGLQGVLAVLTAMGLLALCSLSGIHSASINHAMARGLAEAAELPKQNISPVSEPTPSSSIPKARNLLKNKALFSIGCTLFFFPFRQCRAFAFAGTIRRCPIQGRPSFLHGGNYSSGAMHHDFNRTLGIKKSTAKRIYPFILLCLVRIARARRNSRYLAKSLEYHSGTDFRRSGRRTSWSGNARISR